MRHAPLLLVSALLLPMAALGGQEVEAPSPDPDSLSGSFARALAPGTHIRMRGDAVEELGRPTGREMLIYGILGAHLMKKDAEGTVLFADRDSLVFSDRKRGGVISLDWDRLDAVDVYRGRDVGRGALEGAAWGAVAGVLTWGLMEMIFSGEFWDVDGGVIVGASVAGGAIGGALSLGDRWERVR